MNPVKREKISDNQQLHEWARMCDSALTGVTDRRIAPADFHAVHYAGFMARYKPLHRLAKMILRRLHTDGTGAVHDSGAFTVPFWLDMNALFEKYVEVRLAQAEVNYQAQKTISVTDGTLRWQCRPDFIIGNGFAVLDAKYKAILDNRTDEDGAEQGMTSPWTASTCEGSALPSMISKIIPSDYYLTGCKFSGEQILLTFALVEAQSDSRVRCLQKNAWHAMAARTTTCARSLPVLHG